MVAESALEFHYYLPEKQHSVDAQFHNRCEAELLAIFYEVADSLGIPVRVEAQALREGGVKDVWKWIGDNTTQLGFVISVVALLVTLAPQMFESEKDSLDSHLTELSIEEKRLQIEKLRRELNGLNSRNEESLLDSSIQVLQSEPKISVRRSNLYRNLAAQKEVESIGVTPLHGSFEPQRKERRVYRADFNRFFLTSHALRPQVVDDATIEVISPVLREGNYRWKGLYRGQVVGFTMQDATFRNQVLSKAITFQRGTFLECVLNIHRKLDEVGEVEITGYSVPIVLRKYDDRESIETRQGHAYKDTQRLVEGQGKLFDGNESGV